MLNQPVSQTSLVPAGRFFWRLARESQVTDVTLWRTAHSPLFTLSFSISIVASPWVESFVHAPSPRSKLSARTTLPGSLLLGAGADPLQPGVGVPLGEGVGLEVGVGAGVGVGVGAGVGMGVGTGVGPGVGTGVGAGVGDAVGVGVGTGVGVGPSGALTTTSSTATSKTCALTSLPIWIVTIPAASVAEDVL